MVFDTKVISRSTRSKAQLRSYAFYVKLVMHIKTNATLIPMKSFRTSLTRTCECYQKSYECYHASTFPHIRNCFTMVSYACCNLSYFIIIHVHIVYTITFQRRLNLTEMNLNKNEKYSILCN